MQNPITNKSEVEFLLQEENVYFTAVESYKKQREEGGAVQKAVQWRSNAGWQRLYHAAADDRCKAALRTLTRAKDHEEVDGRHSTEKPKTYYELVAELCNNESVVYHTYALPDLHRDFQGKQEQSVTGWPRK